MSSAPSRGRTDKTKVVTLARERFGEWDALVEKSPNGCLFHFSWWLEATGWRFQIVAAEDEAGHLIAGIALPQVRVAGLTLFYNPPLAPFLGPVFSLEEDDGPIEQLGMVRTIGEALARAIEGYDGMSQWVGAQGPDLQGFLWAGFRAELGYTFRLDAGTPPESLLLRADASHIGKIRHAERSGVVVERSDDIERMLHLSRLTFARQGKEVPWSDDLVRAHWAAARDRGAARLYLARTREGADAAASLVVQDNRTTYHLLAGSDPALRSLGAGNLVILRAASDALHEGRAFDFEGSELRGVEWHYRRWGAIPRPVYVLQRAHTAKGALARLWRRRRNYKQVL